MSDLAYTHAQRKTKGIGLAARLVSDFYDAINRPDLSEQINAGKADDFPEIRSAAVLLNNETTRIDRYEEALAQYADPSFWDEGISGGPLALFDGGEMARNVLAGRPAFFHRD